MNMNFVMRPNMVLLDIFVNIILIAITSIGIEAYNTKENEKFKQQRGSNFTFLVLVLVYAIFRLLIVGGAFAYQNMARSKIV